MWLLSHMIKYRKFFQIILEIVFSGGCIILVSCQNIWQIKQTFLPQFCVGIIFHFSYVNNWIMKSYWDINLHHLMANDVRQLFLDLSRHLFHELLLYIFYPASNQIFCFLTVEFWELFISPRYKNFVRYVVCEFFLPVCNVSFHPLKRAFCGTKILNFDEGKFISAFFNGSCL